MVIRYLSHSIDLRWVPAFARRGTWGKPGKKWYANVQVRIAQAEGKEVGDYYGLIVASPAFASSPRKGTDPNAPYVYIVEAYSEEAVEAEIKRRIGNVAANNWDELREQMAHYFWVD